jgi:diacylglycerol kinase family enzyme
MPLGTGNAWAHSVGAPGWKAALRMLGRAAEAEHLLPRRRFDLVSVLGVEAPFAGAGWDSYILEDYHKSRDGWSLVPRALRTGPVGYLYSTATRTLPRQIFEKTVEVELVNLGEPALRIDAAGRAVSMEGQSGAAGAVLYRGPVGVCGAATTQEYGFRFRAYPHAGLVDGRFCARIYSGSPIDATVNLPDIWRGAHPIRHMHDFLVTRCKMVFDKDVPFQVGGDRIGWRREVEYGIAERPIDLLDWSALRAGPIGRQ